MLVRSLSASQLGVSLAQTVLPGVHAGATLKYVRGTVRTGSDGGLGPLGDVLGRDEDLEGAGAEGHVDLDVGVLAVAGPLRLGAVMRNVREPRFDSAAGAVGVELPRQVRVGVGIDPEMIGGVPLTVALDADVRSYRTASGDRRVVALGAERWFLAKRLGVRAGGRVNTVGARERTGAAGVSVAVRPGLYVEGHAVRGGSEAEAGWGVAARVSF